MASTWIRSWKGDDRDRKRNNRRGGEEGRAVDSVLDRGDTRVLVACSPSDKTRILGWVAYAYARKVPVVHYCYVRREMRGSGVASRMLEHIGCTPMGGAVYTIQGPDAGFLVAKYPASGFLPVANWLYGDQRKVAST